MKKDKFMIALFGLLFSTVLLHAQNTTPISKEEVLERFSTKNVAIKISKQQYLQAKADFSQTNAVYLPNVSVSYTGISTNSPLIAFGTKLNQQVVAPADFDPNLLNNPDRITDFSTRIAFQQPLVNLDGFQQRNAAKAKMQAVELQGTRTKEYLFFEVEKAYMQLQLAYKTVEVLEKAFEASSANKTWAENSLAQGYLQKADVLAVEVRVTEVKNQLLSAKSTVENTSNYLSFLMNENDASILYPSDTLRVIEFAETTTRSVSENRADIKAMGLASEAREAMYTSDRMTFMPRLNAFGSYELHDNQILQGGGDGYLIGAQLSWSLFEGSRRFGKVQKSKAELNKSRLQYDQYISQSQLELNQANRMFADAKNSLALSELALEQSKESLKIRTNRFKQGLEKTSDLLLAETQYAQKQLNYYSTIFQHNYALAYVQFLAKN